MKGTGTYPTEAPVLRWGTPERRFESLGRITLGSISGLHTDKSLLHSSPHAEMNQSLAKKNDLTNEARLSTDIK